MLKKLSAFLYLLCVFGHAFSAETGLIKPIEPVSVYLTWQESPESTMTINWITPTGRKQKDLQYRQAGGEPWLAAKALVQPLPNATPYLLQRIELDGLKADTDYEFRLSERGVVYKFRTMPASLDKGGIRFAVGGDMYHDDLETLHATNKQAASMSPAFVLVGGDIAYASNKLFDFLPHWGNPLIDRLTGQKFDRWLEWLVAWTEDMVTPEGNLIPMLPAIGNHDVIGRYDQTPEQAPFFYTLFAMPGLPGYNVLDFGQYMSIFLLDSGHTNPVGGKQATWLATRLWERKNIPHKFALYHIPAYPSVHKMTEEVGTEIRKYWVPSFDSYHLTAAFENHEHAYKRTHPLLNGFMDPKGVVYIGDGGWGVRKARKPRRVNEKKFLAKTESSRHFLIVDVEQNKQTVRAIRDDGTEIDSYSW
jgi:acid phosphatase type 7